jgi:hypothetical protein
MAEAKAETAQEVTVAVEDDLTSGPADETVPFPSRGQTMKPTCRKCHRDLRAARTACRARLQGRAATIMSVWAHRGRPPAFG